MSARDMWRWLVFSVTGRVPGEEKRTAKEYTRALSTPPGEEATAYMREALARRRVVTADEAAGLGLADTSTDLEEGAPEFKDAAPALNCPHTGDTWFDRSVCAEPCGSMHDRCTWCGEVVGRHGCPIEAGRDQPACGASASAGLLGKQMTFGPCVLREGHQGPVHEAADGSSWEPLDATVPVPRDALRGLVEVARWVAASEPWPDPVPARNALAALYKARLIEQFREEET